MIRNFECILLRTWRRFLCGPVTGERHARQSTGHKQARQNKFVFAHGGLFVGCDYTTRFSHSVRSLAKANRVNRPFMLKASPARVGFRHGKRQETSHVGNANEERT